jgi:alpha-methylacyl-CoA racemase
MQKTTTAGPLAGIKVIEMAGLAPGPFCAMMLADMGAEVLRIDRPDAPEAQAGVTPNLVNRNRRAIAIDVKVEVGLATLRRLIGSADALIEGFRPGVMERLGLGPDDCLAANPRLVYGRITGWGQDGPMAQEAGHDLNYIALAGALHPIGSAEAIAIPLNLVGDFAGGGMYLAFGIACALLEAAKSGQGQIVDAAMVDGAASLMTYMHSARVAGQWSDTRGENILDGGSHFYAVYETRDGRHISVASAEPKFYAALLRLTGLDQDQDLPPQHDKSAWPAMRARLAAIFKTRTRAEWCDLAEGRDVCFAPVLTMAEAIDHPHNRARGVFVESGGVLQPAPAPRFSRTVPPMPRPAQTSVADPDGALAAWGFSAAEIAELRRSGGVEF